MVAWFGNLSTVEKVGVIGSIASLVGVILFFIPSNKTSEQALVSHTETSGVQSPAIGSNQGTVNINNYPPTAQQPTDKERAEQTERAAAEREQARRKQLLSQLRHLYITTHDNISSEMASGLAPLPKKWVEAQLQKRGESWRLDTYN